MKLGKTMARRLWFYLLKLLK